MPGANGEIGTTEGLHEDRDVSVPTLTVSPDTDGLRADTHRSFQVVMNDVYLDDLLQMYQDTKRGTKTANIALNRILHTEHTPTEWKSIATVLKNKMFQEGITTELEAIVYAKAIDGMIDEQLPLEDQINTFYLITCSLFNSEEAKTSAIQTKDRLEGIIEELVYKAENLSHENIQQLKKLFTGSKRFRVREHLNKLPSQAA